MLSLKHILYHALRPQFLNWSKGFPLSIDECELCDKNWVQLVPRQPDIDAIAGQFFEAKARGKAKVFSAKKSANLLLCVKSEKYHEVLQHIADLNEGGEEVRTQTITRQFASNSATSHVLQVLFTQKNATRSSVSTGRRLSAQEKGKKRKLSDSETHKVKFWSILFIEQIIHKKSF